jgi:hypothetical protein
MNSFMAIFKEKVAPKMDRISRNIWISVLKDSILQTLPFILVSSVITF